MTVSFLGAGNVALHLVRAMIENTVQVRQIYNRSIDKAREIGEEYKVSYTDEILALEKADLFIIAASDDAIAEISAQIPYNDIMVAHTSGSTSIDVLQGDYKKGVIYPLQTFSKNRYLDYDDIPFFVEGDNQETFQVLKKLVQRISNRVYELDSHDRKYMHLSAVFVCNFVNFMYSRGQKIAERVDLDFSVLSPLIEETAQKAMYFSPQEVQTGPAIRRDEKTIATHLELLEDLPVEKEIYKLLTDSIIKNYNEL